MAGGAPSAAELELHAIAGTPEARRRRWVRGRTRPTNGEKSAKGAWRLEVSLLFATRSDGNTDPVSLRYGAPQLGQRTIAETASLDFAATTSVAVRGRGAVAHFEFGPETDVRKLLRRHP